MYAEIRDNDIWGPAVEGGITYPESGDMLATATIDSWQTDKDDEEGTYLLWALPEALMLTQTGNN